jgi:hypothetical protein
LGYPKTLAGIKKRLNELDHERNPQERNLLKILYKRISKTFRIINIRKKIEKIGDYALGWTSKIH